MSVKQLRVVLYARVSMDTGEQDPETQLQALRAWAEKRGWRVVAELADRITCDPKRRRREPPGMVEALRMIEEGKADVIAIFGADRLVADPVALLQLVRRVQELGGAIASLRDGRDLDTTDPGNEILVFFDGWFNRMRLRLISEATKAGLARRRAQGVRLGRPPKGVDGAQVAELREQGRSWPEITAQLQCKESTARDALNRHRRGREAG